MNFKEAIELLELPENFDNKSLKKAYYKKARQCHPDKNVKNSTEDFIKINEAYSFLQIEKNDLQENNIDFSYLKKILITLIEKNGNNIVKNLFRNLKGDKCLIYYDFLHSNQKILNISDELLSSLEMIVREKIKNNNVYLLNPTLDDILKNNIYVLNVNNVNHYIPLWHKELVFNNFIVKCIPELPKNIMIDENNNLHYFYYDNIQNILERQKIIINIESLVFEINSNELKIEKYQIKKYKNIGISKIHNSMYETDFKANIIIHIYLN